MCAAVRRGLASLFIYAAKAWSDLERRVDISTCPHFKRHRCTQMNTYTMTTAWGKEINGCTKRVQLNEQLAAIKESNTLVLYKSPARFSNQNLYATVNHPFLERTICLPPKTPYCHHRSNRCALACPGLRHVQITLNVNFMHLKTP